MDGGNCLPRRVDAARSRAVTNLEKRRTPNEPASCPPSLKDRPNVPNTCYKSVDSVGTWRRLMDEKEEVERKTKRQNLRQDKTEGDLRLDQGRWREDGS